MNEIQNGQTVTPEEVIHLALAKAKDTEMDGVIIITAESGSGLLHFHSTGFDLVQIRAIFDDVIEQLHERLQ